MVKGKKREGVKAGNIKQILNFALSACSILLLLWVWFSVSAVNSRLIPTPAVTWSAPYSALMLFPPIFDSCSLFFCHTNFLVLLYHPPP